MMNPHHLLESFLETANLIIATNILQNVVSSDRQNAFSKPPS